MAKEDAVDAAGTPREGHLYAVFHDEQAAEQAERMLAARGVAFTRLRGDEDAQTLKDPPQAGVTSKVTRVLKKLGGESHEAERYGWHLEQGHVVVAIPAKDREEAVALTGMLTDLGAYDATYFTGWTIEHTSWEEDSARGLPTHTTSNVEH